MKTMNKTIICAAAAIALAGCAKEMEMPADQELRKMSFTGVVEEIDAEKNKVTVVVSMFGRETPVELELDQVEVVD